MEISKNTLIIAVVVLLAVIAALLGVLVVGGSSDSPADSPAPASTEEREALYLETVREHAPETIASASDTDLLIAGYTLCAAMAESPAESMQELAERLTAEADSREHLMGMMAVAAAATNTLCPEFGNLPAN